MSDQNIPDDNQDAAFLEVDEADVETSESSTHGEVEPGTDNEDTTVSQLTDTLDSDALGAAER